jgi:hypothetical protein
VAISIAALIKPPSLYLGLPLLFLSYRKYGWRLTLQPALWALAVVAIVPCVLWYRHSYHLWLQYGNTFGIFGINTIGSHFGLTDPAWLEVARWVSQRLVLQTITPIGLIFLGAGLLAGWKKTPLLLSWLAGFAVYILAVPVGHLYHNYYQLPLAFVLTTYMAYGASQLLRRGALSGGIFMTLLVVTIGYSAWQVRPMLAIAEDQRARLVFDQAVGSASEPGSLFVFVDPRPGHADEHPEIYRHRTAEGDFLYCDPIDFYHSRRKGWSIDSSQASPERVEQLRSKGARYLATFFPSNLFETQPRLREILDREYEAVPLRSGGVLYRLHRPSHDDALTTQPDHASKPPSS